MHSREAVGLVATTVFPERVQDMETLVRLLRARRARPAAVRLDGRLDGRARQ